MFNSSIPFLLQCTVASKFLTLTESVRDAADLNMSLKYPPIVFICDSPCGMVSHLECRAPDLCEALWGENSGYLKNPSMPRNLQRYVLICVTNSCYGSFELTCIYHNMYLVPNGDNEGLKVPNFG